VPKGNSIADRLEEIKTFYEDVRECSPDLWPHFCGDPKKRSAAVLKAANYFNLDLTSEAESALLLQILAGVVFPGSGRPKRSKQWGIARLTKLGTHWREVERASPGISDSKAAKEIKKRYPKLYQSDVVIRPRLPDAKLMSAAGRNLIAETMKKNLLKSSRPQNTLDDLATVVDINGRLQKMWLGDLLGLSRENRRKFLKQLPSNMALLAEIRAEIRDIAQELQKAAQAGSQQTVK
jgi:hypothetical protein